MLERSPIREAAKGSVIHADDRRELDASEPAPVADSRVPAGSPRLPNFLIIGAMKAGTTSLYHYVRAHPQVFVPAIKEIDFVVAAANWARGIDWYGRQCTGAGPDVVAVEEASTNYTKYPSIGGVPACLADHVPGVRLLHVVRDPIERIRFHYRNRVAVGTDRAPYEQAVLDYPIYLDCSRYATLIEQFLKSFSRFQLMIVTSEELRHSKVATIQQVYAFLGVDPDPIPAVSDREFSRTDEGSTFAPAAWKLRRALNRRGPERAKELVDSVLTRSRHRVARRPDKRRTLSVPDRLRFELEELLKDDMRRLRVRMTKGFGGWGLA